MQCKQFHYKTIFFVLICISDIGCKRPCKDFINKVRVIQLYESKSIRETIKITKIYNKFAYFRFLIIFENSSLSLAAFSNSPMFVQPLQLLILRSHDNCFLPSCKSWHLLFLIMYSKYAVFLRLTIDRSCRS